MSEGDKGDRKVDTGGGAYVEGEVQTGGGDFIGRDRIVHGDEVAGDKIAVGDLVGGVAAIGRGASVIIKNALSTADEAREQEEYARQKLAEAVARLAENLGQQASLPLQVGNNPYQSLLEFTLGDAPCYFGRTQAVEKLVESYLCEELRCRFVVLHGDSGVGKSSLLRAGLVPVLVARQHLPLLVRLTPGTVSVAESVKRSLLPDIGTVPDLESAPLQGFLRLVATVLPAGRRISLLLDQFEWFFNQPADIRDVFIEELARCLFDEDLPANWLISVRSDRLGHLNSFQPAIPQPFASTYVLPPLLRAEARQAILEPASLAGLKVEEPLLNALLEDLGRDAIDPSRLQLVCHTLVDELPTGERRLTSEAYIRNGRVEGILQAHLDRVLERHFVSADREIAWRLLVFVSENTGEPLTAQGLLHHLKPYEVDPDAAARVLSLLETNRLLQLRGEGYQLISDSLKARIQAWAAEVAAVEKARAEVARQVERIRGSALRGLLGGALGFSLAYLVAFFPSIGEKSLLAYLAMFRTVPGALVGLLLILSVDLALACYQGPRRRVLWVVGGLVGAGSFAVALLFHTVLDFTADLPRMILSTLEGALWGLVTGLGTVWVLMDRHFVRRKLALVVLGGSVTLALGDAFGQAFESPPFAWRVMVAGALMPLFVVGAASIVRPGRSEIVP